MKKLVLSAVALVVAFAFASGDLAFSAGPASSQSHDAQTQVAPGSSVTAAPTAKTDEVKASDQKAGKKGLKKAAKKKKARKPKPEVD